MKSWSFSNVHYFHKDRCHVNAPMINKINWAHLMVTSLRLAGSYTRPQKDHEVHGRVKVTQEDLNINDW